MKKPTEHKGKVIDRVEGYKVIDCQECGFKHVSPIPTDEQLDKLYREKFYTKKKANYLKDAEADLEWWTETYKNYFHLLEKHAPGKKLLDIGSGPGYFLKTGKDLGWDVTGFEPSADAAEYASKKLKVKVINDFFGADKAKDLGKFDVVCLSLVLEHLPNPVGLLKEAKSVLKPGGVIFIISPNDYNPLQKVLNESLDFKPWWVSPEQHINYFDFESAQRLLKKLGFKTVEINTSYPMELFLLSGNNYIGNRILGRKCHQQRKNFEINLYKHNPELLNSLYADLAKNGIGREFVVIAKSV
jgi:SAM-dependent methyltransferase